MQSASMLATHSGDRPSFQADINRGLFRSAHYQVFAMPQGLLCLEMRLKDYGNLGADRSNAAAMAFCFGAIGGMASAMQAAAHDKRYGARPEDRWESGFDSYDEDDLLDLAKQRKKSFVCKEAEILGISIDAPGFLGRTLGDNSVAGRVTVRDAKIGKISMVVRGEAALMVAVEALPRRYGERVRVNCVFDQRERRFVPR
jgi:hypothetical protein